MKTQTLILLCMMTLSSTSCGKNEEVRIVEELITENGSGSEQEKPTPNDSTSLHAPDKGTMENVNPHDYIADAIDLGLSVKWASFNIGASKPEEYGGLYGWADGTGTKTSAEYDDYPTANPPADICGTEYDIAHTKWGGKWRLPSLEEQQELVNRCKLVKSSYHNVRGYTVTGSNGNQIFLPGVGGRIEDKTYYQVDGADYWSGTLSSNKKQAYYLYYYIGEEPTVGTLPRYYGFAVRAVCN